MVRILSLALALVVTVATSPASAQYFGRNKVQYKDLDFEVLKTEHFDIYFYPSAKEGVDLAARMAERWLARLERVLEHELRGRQPLVLYASHPDFEQTNVIQGELSEGTGGVTESLRRRIILPIERSARRHGPRASVTSWCTRSSSTSRRALAGNPVRRARTTCRSGSSRAWPNTCRSARSTRTRRCGCATPPAPNRCPTISELNNPKYFPYRWGQAFWAYVAGKWGDGVVRQMLSIGAAAGDPEVAIRRVLGLSADELSAGMALRDSADLRTDHVGGPGRRAKWARWCSAARRTPSAAASTSRRRSAPTASCSRFCPSAACSRSISSSPMPRPGRSSTSSRARRPMPHYSSLQFIHSAGAWDRASERIAIATVTAGKPALAIFNARTGDKEREVPLPGVDEIFNPTWAPDGRVGRVHGDDAAG